MGTKIKEKDIKTELVNNKNAKEKRAKANNKKSEEKKEMINDVETKEKNKVVSDTEEGNNSKNKRFIDKIKDFIKKYYNFSIWKIVAYFIIYSFFGFIIETIFGVLTMGVLQSRQSFLYGPFCGIYGFGAVVMILALQPFKKNKYSLFFGGYIVGSIVEYVLSFLGEYFFHVIWWDYSNMPLNINGRICAFYSIFWGLLGIYLISHVNPLVDKLIAKIKGRLVIINLKVLEIVVSLFLVFDIGATVYALNAYFIRVVKENDINVWDREIIDAEYERIYGDEKRAEFIYKYFGNEKMLKTFPNLKISDNDGNIIYFDSLYKDIQTYYYKFRD